MTLADLLTDLAARGTLPRAEQKKTSLRYLAAALGAGSLETCPVDATCRDADRWEAALETHFQGLTAQGRTIGASTRRNTRNDIRVVFRAAAAHGLLQAPLPPVLLARPHRHPFRRQQEATTPYQKTYRNQTPRHYSLPQAQWPPEIQAGWRTYRAKCGVRIRETSFRTYARQLGTYLGYLVHICGRTPTWDDLFDREQVMEFVGWHGARVGRRVSVHGRQVVMMLAAMANVLEHPHARKLADFRNTLKPPAPLHIKREHWVSLATLEAVAEACFAEGRVPPTTSVSARNRGVRRATRFQVGLMLKLLVRVPLRQRNLREMQLRRHLYQDQAGHWQLSFSGDDLKIGTRQGRVNTYHVDLTDYCPDFLPVLEEFLTVHRPRLPGTTPTGLLFMTQYGTPYTVHGLRNELTDAVAMRTGQRFYPHLIRTIWATEFLEKTQDFTTAATMLGDTLAVVMMTYYDIVHKDQHAKAKAFLGTALHAG
jgi:hypothetical protein